MRWMDGGVVGGCGVGLIGIVDGACGMDAGWSWGLGGFWDAAGDCAVADCGVGRDMVWLWLWWCGWAVWCWYGAGT